MRPYNRKPYKKVGVLVITSQQLHQAGIMNRMHVIFFLILCLLCFHENDM